ncbi:MAG: 3'-5' exonuclease [bacterium]
MTEDSSLTANPDFVFFDLETTGFDPRSHEIVEIGAVRTSADLADVRGEFERKIQPEHIETAMPESLKVNGYTPELWANAVPLASALADFAAFGTGGVLAAYNITFDWMFLHIALLETKTLVTFDYHRFDVFSIAYENARREKEHFPLDMRSMCRLFGVPVPPDPHRALADAQTALALLRAFRGTPSSV